jgi:tetratricopeptide (TPR) repeat protein
VGQNLHFARRYDESVEQLRSTLEMDQNYWLAHSILARNYEQQQKTVEAIAEFQRALDLEKDVPENYAMLAHAYGLAGKKSESEKLLSELREMSAKRHVPAYNVATIYVGAGDKDQVFAWLERAYAERSFYLTWLKYDPQLDSLRSDPRFADLMRRVGLPQ